MRWGSAHRIFCVYSGTVYYLTVIFWMFSVPETVNVTLLASPLHVPALKLPQSAVIVLTLPPVNTMLLIVPSLTLTVIVELL